MKMSKRVRIRVLFMALLMLFNVSLSLSACTKGRGGDKQKPAAESIEETGGKAAGNTKDSGKTESNTKNNGNAESNNRDSAQQDDEIAQNVKDAMNEVLDQADVELSPDEREAINGLFDLFAQ